jgi:hypothetical protein
MLLELTPDALTTFIQFRSKDAQAIRETLLLYDVKMDPKLNKEQLLEKFFHVLSENARVEKGEFSFTSSSIIYLITKLLVQNIIIYFLQT